MYNKNNIKNPASRLLLMFLILSQLFNALLVVDLLDIGDKIVLNSEVDNSAKEDKNTLDCGEEFKILYNLFDSIYFSNDSMTIDYIVQNFKEVLNSEDFPPPEANSQV